MAQNEETLPIVDESGGVIDKAYRSECHNDSKLLHPVVHLHVLNAHGKLLLQLRSASKRIQPGRWDTAVGGHVSYGESIVQALQREALEEIGLTDVSEVFRVGNYIFESDVEREMVYCHVVYVDDSFQGRVEPGEADELRFWSLSDVEEVIGNGILTPNFEKEFKTVLLPYLQKNKNL